MRHLLQLLLVYLLGIVFFTAFRILLLLTNGPAVAAIPSGKATLLLRALFMGWRFDTVIACYLLALPAVLLGILLLLAQLRKEALVFCYAFIAVVFSISFLACAADIPFFNHFFARLNDTVFNWTANAGFGFRMILQEPKFLAFAGAFLALTLFYLWLLRKIYRAHLQVLLLPAGKPAPGQRLRLAPFVLLLWGVMFLGIRGRTDEKSPIHPGVAAFSNNPFINQVGLNPVFTLMRSTLDSRDPRNHSFQTLPDSVALETMALLLHADSSLASVSPIARYQQSDAPLAGRNIVLIMMESMSAAKMGRFGNPDQLTPFLDSLADNCWSFDEIYSAGIHTYNGVYSTLFAHPAIMKRHTMEGVSIPQMAGFPNVLSRYGYQSIFFTTHDEVFDNMSGFLTANGFDHIVGQKDYPAKEVKSTLGVPDEFMFRFAVPRLNQLAASDKPFFAAFMTASDHDPIVIPNTPGFHRRHAAAKQAVVSYADWSLQQFMAYAADQSWYDNTVFVFVADHGAMMGISAYDIAFSYHHTPFLIFAPGATTPRVYKQQGLQTDVFATVVSLVLPRFLNNTFSIDLRTQSRPYSVFSADDKLVCLNDSLLYIWRMQSDPGVYHYRDNNSENRITSYPHMATLLQRVAFSWLQTSEWLLRHKRAGLP